MILTTVFEVDAQKAFDSDNLEIKGITQKVDRNGWLYFKEDVELKKGDLFLLHAEAMGLGDNDKMVLKKEIVDKLGITHVKYKQEYKGFPVDGGEYIVHLKDCLEYLANGVIVENINLNTKPEISENEAFEIAKKATKSKLFAWENIKLEQELRIEQKDSSATYLPKPEMVIALKKGKSLKERNYSFVYRFNIEVEEPYAVYQVDVDAATGEVFNMFNTVVDCFSQSKAMPQSKHLISDFIGSEEKLLPTGSASLPYYGTQSIQTKFHNGLFSDYYYLKDNTRGNGIKTKDYYSWSKIKDSDNNWPNSDGKYTQAHWTIEKAWDYFLDSYGLDGTNGNGKKVKIKANWNNENANYHGNLFGQRINVGKTSSDNHLSTLDILGHEYTHGVTQYSANLDYYGESGALNESFSDIFGTMVENYADGVNFDWTMGEDASWIIRDISDPTLYGQPDTYLGSNWVSTSGPDYGGVHTNSGVQNKWFYLLSEGGTLNGVSVQGIGKEKAAKIAFRNLTKYLTRFSNYTSARIGAINSAIDLYGHCSFEEIQTTNAWAAVGVGNEFVGNCVQIIGPHIICLDFINPSIPIVFKAIGLPGSTFTWSQIPNTWNYSINGNGNKYLKVSSISSIGTANLKVNSSQGGSDTHYVIVRKCKIHPHPCDEMKK